MILRFVIFLFAVLAQAELLVGLNDGTRLVGSSSTDTLAIKSDFGELSFPLSELLEMQGEKGQFLVRLHNGDRFGGQLRTPHLQLRTKFGDTTVPAAKIVSIRVSAMDGVVAWWSGNGNADDRWGRHHGTGSFLLASDRHGRPDAALHFVDHTHKIVVADHADLDTLERFTWAVWIRPEAYADPSGNDPFIVSKWYTRPRIGSYLFGLGLEGQLQVSVATSVEGFVEKKLATARDSIPLERWTHVAATFERGRVALYINGSLAANAYFEEVQRTEPTEYTHDELVIGGFWNQNYDYKGAMDDLMLFRRALSPAEIATLAAD